MLENFLFMILLILVNLIFMFKRIPLVAFPIGIFSFYIGAVVFLYDDSIPSNPYSTVFFVLLVVCMILANVLDLNDEKKGRE